MLLIFFAGIISLSGFLSVTSELKGGARGQNLGHFFLNVIIQFKQQVLFWIGFLSVTSDCRVQCPCVELEVNILDTSAEDKRATQGNVPLRALFLVSNVFRDINEHSN